MHGLDLSVKGGEGAQKLRQPGSAHDAAGRADTPSRSLSRRSGQPASQAVKST